MLLDLQQAGEDFKEMLKEVEQARSTSHGNCVLLSAWLLSRTMTPVPSPPSPCVLSVPSRYLAKVGHDRGRQLSCDLLWRLELQMFTRSGDTRRTAFDFCDG